jgi:hypothetical protein
VLEEATTKKVEWKQMLAPEVTLQIAGKVSLIPIRVLCHRLVIKGQMGAVSGKYHLNSENWTDMHKQVRSWFNFNQ